MGDHVLPRLLDAGVVATVNSDDPAYFGGYLGENLAAVRAEFGLDAAQLATPRPTASRASFLPRADKLRLLSLH